MKKVDLNEFIRRITEKFPLENFEVLEYHSWRKPAIIKCCSCGKEIHVSSAGNFCAKNKKYGCVNCNGLWKQREKILQEIKIRYDIIATDVKDTHTIFTIKCKKCGHIRKTRLSNIKIILTVDV